MAENRVRIIIEADGRQAQTVVDALGNRLRALGEEAQAGTGGARVSLEAVTSEAKKTTTAVDETGRKLEDVGPRAQTGAGTAKTALAGVGVEGRRSAQSVEEAFRTLGVRSSAAIRQEMAGVVAAYRRVADSGVASARDQELALARAKERVRELRAELARSSASMAAPVQSAAMAVGDMAGMLGQLRSVVGGLSLGYVFREAARAAREAIQVVDDYKLAIIGVASSLTDMNKGTAAELRDIYQQNARYAQETYDKVELAAGKFFASSKEMVSAWQILTNKGITLTSDQDINNLGVIVDKIKLMTQGQSSSLQIAQELRAVLSGQARATDQIAMLLRDRLGPEWEAQLNAALEQGRALDFIASQFAGLAAASGDIQNTVTAQLEQQHTIVNQIVRAGFVDMYQDVATLLERINSVLLTHKGIIGDVISEVYRWSTAALSVMTQLSPLGSAIKFFTGRNPFVVNTDFGWQARRDQKDIDAAQEHERRKWGISTKAVVTNPPKPRGDMKDLPTWEAFRDTLGVSSAETDVARRQASINKEINERLATLKEFHRQGKVSEQDYQQWINHLEQARTTRLKDAAAARSGAITKGLKADMLAAESFAAFYAAKEAYNTETLRGEVDARRKIFENAYREIRRIASMGDGPAPALAAIDEAHAFATAAYGPLPGFDVWRAGARDEVWREELEQRTAAARDYTEFEAAQHALETGSYRDALTRQIVAREAAYERLAEIDGRAVEARKQALADELAEIEASGRATAEIRAMYAGLAADEDRNYWAERRQNATDFASAYRAAVAEQTALAASGGEEERRIWAEVAEQMALLSDEVYSSRAEMYDRIVAKAQAAGLDEARAAALASRQIDDLRRQQLEFVRDNPTSLGEAMSAAWALESGSYKSDFGQMQDGWRDTTQRMLQMSNDLSSGIAQGFGDMARQSVNHLVDMLGPVGTVVGRLADVFLSFFEDLMAEWFRRNIMGLIFDDAQSLARGLGGSGTGGGIGIGNILSAFSGSSDNSRFNGGYATHDGRSTLSYGWQGNQYASPSGGWWGRNGTAVLGAAAGLATAAGGVASGNALMSVGGGLLAAGSLLTAVNPVIGGLVAGIGGLVSIFSGLNEQEKERQAQPVWQGRAMAWLGGSMLGYGYTQMDDGSYKISAIDPAELEQARQAFQDNVNNMNKAMKALEIDFTKGWESTFSFVSMPVPDELRGAVEFVMMSNAAAYALGDLANAVRLAQDGYEALDDVLIRLGAAFGTVAPRVESLGLDLFAMGAITDGQILQYAAVSRGLAATSAELLLAMEGLTGLSDATRDVIEYFRTFRTQLGNILAAQYAELLIDEAGDAEAFEAAIQRFADGAFTSREQAENALSYYQGEFQAKFADAGTYLPGFDTGWIQGSVDGFWAAYREAMDNAMPPSAFGWWAEVSGFVSGLQEVRKQLESIESQEWAFDKGLEYRKMMADNRDQEAGALKTLIDAEQELADARASNLTYAQQLALVETQIYELQAQLRDMLGQGADENNYDAVANKLEVSVRKQLELMQEQALLAEEAADAYRRAAKSLRDTIDDIALGTESPLSPGARYTQALEAYQATKALAERGDRTALANIGGDAQAMLAAAKASMTDMVDYQRVYYRTLRDLDQLADTSDEFAEQEDLLRALSEIQAALLSTMQSILAAFGDPDLLLEAEDLLAILQDPTQSLSDYLGHSIDFEATRIKIQTAQAGFLEAVLAAAGTELEELTATYQSYNLSGAVASGIAARIQAIQDALADRSTEDAVKAIEALQDALPGYRLPEATTAALSGQLGAVLVELTGSAAAASLQALGTLSAAVTDFEHGDIAIDALVAAFEGAQVQIVDTVTLTALRSLEGFEQALAAYSAGEITFTAMYDRFADLQHGLISDTITNAVDVLERVKVAIQSYVAGDESYAALVVLFEDAQEQIAATGSSNVLRELESLRQEIAAYEADPNTATKALQELRRVQDLMVSGGALAALEALEALKGSLDSYGLDAATSSRLRAQIAELEQSLVVTSTDAAAKEIETLLAAIGSFGLPASVRTRLEGQLTDLQSTLSVQGAVSALHELAEIQASIAEYAVDASTRGMLTAQLARIQRDLVVADATAAQDVLGEILATIATLQIDAATKADLVRDFAAIQDALTYAGTVAAYLAAVSLQKDLSSYDLSSSLRAEIAAKLSTMQDALVTSDVSGALKALATLQAAIRDYDMPDDVRSQLAARLATAQTALSTGNVSGALTALDGIKKDLPGYGLDDGVREALLGQLFLVQKNLVVADTAGARTVLAGILSAVRQFALEQGQVQAWTATIENQQVSLIRQGVKGAREELVKIRTAVSDFRIGKTDFTAFQKALADSQLGILEGAISGALDAVQGILNVGSPVAAEALKKLLEAARQKVFEKLLAAGYETTRGVAITTQAQLKNALEKNTLDVSALTSAQAGILKAQIDSLSQLSLAVGQPISVSAALLDALQEKLDGTAEREDWAALIAAMDTYRDDVVETIKASILARQDEARSLQTSIDAQLEVQEEMEKYFQSISQYLVRQTKVETLSAQIHNLKATQSSANSSAMMAMLMGVPLAAISHMQTAQAVGSQIAVLETELALWQGVQINTPDVTGTAATGKTSTQVVNNLLARSNAISQLVTDSSAAGLTAAQKSSLVDTLRAEIASYKSMSTWKTQDAADKMLLDAKLADFHAALKAVEAKLGVDIPGFRLGGIAWEPQLAHVAEDGPEAYVPLRSGRIPVHVLTERSGGDCASLCDRLVEVMLRVLAATERIGANTASTDRRMSSLARETFRASIREELGA